MSSTAKVVRFDRHGDTGVLYVAETDVPEPGPGEVVVQMRAASANSVDTVRRRGTQKHFLPLQFPATQGGDIAGVVHSVGSDVRQWSPGDEVLGWNRAWNTHASHAAVPADQLVPKPRRMAWTTAGSLYMIGAAATAVVKASGAGPGDTVLVSGASGGVGATAVQLLRERGASVIGAASAASAEWLWEIGAVPVTYGADIERQVRSVAGTGVSAVIDLAGPEYLDLGAALGVARNRIVSLAAHPRARQLGAVVTTSRAGSSIHTLESLVERITDGNLRVRVAATYPLERVGEAMRRLEDYHSHGKIVLTNGPML